MIVTSPESISYCLQNQVAGVCLPRRRSCTVSNIGSLVESGLTRTVHLIFSPVKNVGAGGVPEELASLSLTSWLNRMQVRIISQKFEVPELLDSFNANELLSLDVKI